MVFPMKMVCMHEMMRRQMHRPTQILKAPGRMLLSHNEKFCYLYGSWILIVLKLLLSVTGVSLSAQSPLSVGLMLVDPVNPESNGLHCFEGELDMLSCWPLSGSQPAMHHSHVASELVYHCVHSPQQNLHILPVPDCCWWATGSFCVGCRCTLPHLWDIPHTLAGLGKVAIQPHTPFSPICFTFYACSWMQWHRQGQCPPSLRTLPCCICHNFAYGILLPSVGEVCIPVGWLNMVPQLLNGFVGSGCGYWLWGILRVTLMGVKVVYNTSGKRGWSP